LIADLHLTIVLRLAIAVVEITFVVLLIFLSRAPGWSSLRALVVSGTSAAIYALSQVPFAMVGVPDGTLAWLSRLASLAASINAVSWLWYIKRDLTPQVAPSLVRWLSRALVVFGVLSLVPGQLTIKEVFRRNTAYFRMDVHPGPIISFNALLVVLAFALVFAHYLRGARQKVSGALASSVAFAIFFALAVHEGLVLLGVYEGPYVIGLGFLVLMIARVGIVARKVAEDAEVRLRLSVELESKVQQRTNELTQAREALLHKERLAALGQLAAGVGHEINNPLTYVFGNLQYLLAMSPPLPEEVHEIVKETLEGAERVRKIVRDLRALGKGAAGDRAEPISVLEAISGAHKLVAVQLQGKNISLEVDADDSRARIDRGRLGQVLVNLILNTATALPESLNGRERRTIQVAARRDGANVRIQVKDRGIGIKSHDLPHVLEPFYTTRSDTGGTGLGLYVCHSVVTSYGGSLDVASTDGEGTTVTITLPLAEALPAVPSAEDAHATPQASPSPPPSTESKPETARLLLVDDDAPVARIMARMLTGYQIDVAHDVHQAKELLGKRSYAAVLCDLRMSGGSGMVLFAHLRESHPALARRFMLVTGGGLTREEREELDVFFAPIIQKPVVGAELRQALEKLLQR
jgi:signal transduction histidine kinase/CheY-like chemotaxis protein